MKDNYTDKKVDEIMKIALASEVEPEEELNQRIIRRWKEQTIMKKQIARRVYAAAAACSVLMVGVTVGAAVKYLGPEEVAQRSGMEQEKILTAFSSEDAIEINESQEAGGYRFTLMGITTEQGLEESAISEEVRVQGDMYAIVAVENLDGTPMPDISDDAYSELAFFMSPLVEGLEPWQYNTASMGGAYSDIVENGIMYRIIASDDISIFADRDLYLCVSDTTFYDTTAYCYDEATGAISRNGDYEGVNLLFDLPLDPAKADPEKASEYLGNLEADWEQSDEMSAEESAQMDSIDVAINDTDALLQEIDTQIRNGEEETALKNAELLSDQTKIVTEEDGSYAYEYSSGEGETTTLYFYKEDFTNGKDVMISYGDFDESTEQFEGIYITVLTEQGDNTAEIRTYFMAF